MTKRLKSHTFRGKRWDLTFVDGEVDGLCVQPKPRRGEIILFEGRTPKAFLEAAIHESMHALNWSIPEKVIEERAHEITNLLWRLGYRREP